MNYFLARLMSLKNLSRANAGGQISTLMILLLVIIIAFVMVTVNIGDVAQKSIVISNAADAAALQLGSSLSQKARSLWDGLGQKTEKCQKKGFWSMILSIVVAIIAVFVCTACLAAMGSLFGVSSGIVGLSSLAALGSTGVMIGAATGAVAGAVGGAIGAAIDGTSIAQGAISGFAIGAAIGSVAVGAAGMSATSAQSALATSNFAVNMPTIVYAGIGTVAFGVLGLGSAVYNSVAATNSVSTILKRLADEMNKLNEKDRFRENAFLQAMAQAVDDPNKVPDQYDLDGDGDMNELISEFLEAWHKRIMKFQEMKNVQIAEVEAFKPKMQSFADSAYDTYKASGIYSQYSWNWASGNWGQSSISAGQLEKREYAWYGRAGKGDEEKMVGPPQAQDGPLVNVLRQLYDAGQRWTVSGGLPHEGSNYWEPGPDDPDDMNAWFDQDCNTSDCFGDSCSSALCSDNMPAGYDVIDAMGDWMESATYTIDELIAVGSLSSSWEGWIEFFYNFSEDPAVYAALSFEERAELGTIYDDLEVQIAFLNDLETQLNRTIAGLPPCTTGNYESGATAVTNPFTGVTGYVVDGVPSTCVPCGSTGPSYFTWCFGGSSFYGGCSEACGAPQCVTNAPCRFGGTHSGGTLDEVVSAYDSDGNMTESYHDDFEPAFTAIDDLRTLMQGFRTDINNFQLAMRNAVIPEPAVSGGHYSSDGYNPMWYKWSDARGDSRVKVQSGNFRVPYLKTKKSWSKVCVRLKKYTDDNKCWIALTKQEPTTEAAPLGKWNPFNRGITKIGRAGYSYDHVELEAISNK